jgi:para-aminobenzoate synthetase component 1
MLLPMIYPEFAQICLQYLASDRPFVFVVDFEKEHWNIVPTEEAASQGIFYAFREKTNAPLTKIPASTARIEPVQEAVEQLRTQYSEAFDFVQTEINWGNSFLLNLTFPVEVQLQGSFEEVFLQSNAPYRLYVKDQFTVFSPESFIRVGNGEIETFPMKGTIPANESQSAKRLIADPKEQAEHATIVDLLRNDLSQIAQKVRVENYRFLEKIKRPQGGLWQTSTHIKGQLRNDWKVHFPEYLNKLLPAGSVSGAPKPQTLEIIRQAEGQKRGYYTGVFGHYDGQQLESAVAIRFLENRNNKVYYRAGGGITHLSQCEHEFDELLQKVYLPTL